MNCFRQSYYSEFVETWHILELLVKAKKAIADGAGEAAIGDLVKSTLPIRADAN